MFRRSWRLSALHDDDNGSNDGYRDHLSTEGISPSPQHGGVCGTPNVFFLFWLFVLWLYVWDKLVSDVVLDLWRMSGLCVDDFVVLADYCCRCCIHLVSDLASHLPLASCLPSVCLPAWQQQRPVLISAAMGECRSSVCLFVVLNAR